MNLNGTDGRFVLFVAGKLNSECPIRNRNCHVLGEFSGGTVRFEEYANVLKYDDSLNRDIKSAFSFSLWVCKMK